MNRKITTVKVEQDHIEIFSGPPHNNALLSQEISRMIDKATTQIIGLVYL